MDVAVVGGGVAGLSVAWRLAKAGVAVTLFEKDAVGAGASSAAAGMLAPTAEASPTESELVRISCASVELWPDFVRALEQESGVDIDYRTEGTLVVAIDRDDHEALQNHHRQYLELGLAAELIDGDDVREREPALDPATHGAVFCPNDHQVVPRRLIGALTIAAKKAGATIREHTAITSILSDGGSCRGVRADGDIEAKHVVLAPGAWLRDVDGQPDRPHVRPVRGQMLSLEMNADAPICRHVIRAPDAYLVPKSDGRLLVGSTMEEVGFDARLTAGGVFEILRGAWEAMPGTYDLPLLDSWTGFRPISLDNEPILRQSESLKNLWYAAGFGRNGILLTPVASQIVANQILSEL